MILDVREWKVSELERPGSSMYVKMRDVLPEGCSKAGIVRVNRSSRTVEAEL